MPFPNETIPDPDLTVHQLRFSVQLYIGPTVAADITTSAIVGARLIREWTGEGAISSVPLLHLEVQESILIGDLETFNAKATRISL